MNLTAFCSASVKLSWTKVLDERTDWQSTGWRCYLWDRAAACVAQRKTFQAIKYFLLERHRSRSRHKTSLIILEGGKGDTSVEKPLCESLGWAPVVKMAVSTEARCPLVFQLIVRDSLVIQQVIAEQPSANVFLPRKWDFGTSMTRWLTARLDRGRTGDRQREKEEGMQTDNVRGEKRRE